MSNIHPYVNAWLTPVGFIQPLVYGSESAQKALMKEANEAAAHFRVLQGIVAGSSEEARVKPELQQYAARIRLLEDSNGEFLGAFVSLRLFVQQRQIAATAAIAAGEDRDSQFSLYLSLALTRSFDPPKVAGPSASQKTRTKYGPPIENLSALLHDLPVRIGITPTALMRHVVGEMKIAPDSFWRWYRGAAKELTYNNRERLAEILAAKGATVDDIRRVFGEEEARRLFQAEPLGLGFGDKSNCPT